MKRILIIVIALAPCLVLAACGQGSGPAPTSSASATQPAPIENVDQLLSKMEQDWVDALVKGDAAFHESILADDYVGVGPDGRIVGKSQSVPEVRSGAFKTESMTIDGIVTVQPVQPKVTGVPYGE